MAAPLHAEPVIVDADDARSRAQRTLRDPIEGLWGVYHKWYPVSGVAKSYRVSIVKNVYNVFPEAKYLGVVMCNTNGCVRGEVRFLFSPAKKKGEYRATVLTGRDDVEGNAVLGKNTDGKPNTALDMRQVTYDGRVMMNWMVRIKGM